MDKGLIVSIQGYSIATTVELAGNAIRAGAVGIRTDKNMKSEVPTIGVRKIKVQNRDEMAFITVDVEAVKDVARWADLIACDCRCINPKLMEIAAYCKENRLAWVADIATIDDYKNLIAQGLAPDYVATTLSVLESRFEPDLKLVADLAKAGCKKIIAEGNYHSPWQVKQAYENGAYNVCIGAAISDVYKNTRRFVLV